VLGPPPDHGLERVENERVGAVSDRVDADLEPPLGRGTGARLELVDGKQEEPSVRRVVAVRRVERRATGAERAVRHQLHRPHDQPSVAAACRALVERRLPRGGVDAPERDVIPERERP
jgi:hypothetical protein